MRGSLGRFLFLLRVVVCRYLSGLFIFLFLEPRNLRSNLHHYCNLHCLSLFWHDRETRIRDWANRECTSERRHRGSRKIGGGRINAGKQFPQQVLFFKREISTHCKCGLNVDCLSVLGAIHDESKTCRCISTHQITNHTIGFKMVIDFYFQ